LYLTQDYIHDLRTAFLKWTINTIFLGRILHLSL
jgi:hypothetical protein